jgi:hypothetical protein
MKIKLYFASVLLMGFMFNTSAIANEESKNWLAVHTSEMAKMTSPTTLVMSGAREVFAFTDRPNREYNYLNVHEFVSLWVGAEDGGFKSTPPNAVITWVQEDKLNEAEVLLSDAKAVSFGREIEFSIELLTGSIPTGAELQNVSMFIDGFSFFKNMDCLADCH